MSANADIPPLIRPEEPLLGQQQPRSGVLLKTAVAKVTSRIYTADANILFDEGAQRSFVTRELADKLFIY